MTHFSWVTDFRIDPTNLMTLMRGARARWKIENETFNTLKNQGYHFEHNFGHGNQHLSTVLMHLMMLAFLIDQIQQRSCRLFQSAVKAAEGKTRFWRLLRSFFDICLIPDWETLYRAIITPPSLPLGADTSSLPPVTEGARSAVLEGDRQPTVSASPRVGAGLLCLPLRAAAACSPWPTTRRTSGNCWSWILDVDVTVKPLYGHQEGAVKGYNPHQPGRPSHTYHTYFLSSLR